MITSVTASEDVRAQNGNRAIGWSRELWGLIRVDDSTPERVSQSGTSRQERRAREGESPVYWSLVRRCETRRECRVA
jgi:hypothetical protein